MMVILQATVSKEQHMAWLPAPCKHVHVMHTAPGTM